MIAGYMKGHAAQWFTTQMKIHGVDMEEIWESRKAFWMDPKDRFGDSDLNFSVRTRLQKLKQGEKPPLSTNISAVSTPESSRGSLPGTTFQRISRAPNPPQYRSRTSRRGLTSSLLD